MEAFDAEIIQSDRGGAYVRVPTPVIASLGGGGRIPVRATFDGIAYQGSIVSMGDDKILGMLKSIRSELDKEPGDVVGVTVEVDRSERSIEVPADLRAALDAAEISGVFSALSYSHQREYVLWIDEAKKPETRGRRVQQTIDRLRP